MPHFYRVYSPGKLLYNVCMRMKLVSNKNKLFLSLICVCASLFISMVSSLLANADTGSFSKYLSAMEKYRYFQGSVLIVDGVRILL